MEFIFNDLRTVLIVIFDYLKLVPHVWQMVCESGKLAAPTILIGLLLKEKTWRKDVGSVETVDN